MPKVIKENKKTDSMQKIVEDLGKDIVPVKEGAIVEVIILAKSKNRILADVSGICYGIVLDKEFSVDVNDLKPGDKVLAYILTSENDEGYAVLSLRKADKERFNQKISENFQEEKNVRVRIKQANKGGLIAEYGGIEGFLPVSQLSNEHYPKVGDNKNKIFEKLNEFVGKALDVKIINYDKTQNKLIFSEKAALSGEIQNILESFKKGQVIDGVVSGIVDFGLFVDLGKIEGLVHISEVSWDRIDNLKSLYKIGDKVKVEVISIDDSKVSLSIKRLLPDPWLDKIKGLKKDNIVEGKVERVTPFGVFVMLPNKISGLVHISELSEKLKDGKKMDDVLSIGKNYKFKIISIETNSHKINLSIPKEDEDIKTSKPAKKTVAKTKKTKKTTKSTE